MGIRAYRKTIAQTETPRQIERRLLTEVTADLKEQLQFDLLQDAESKLNLLAQGLRETVCRNQRIWQVLKFDLIESENALDPALRANLISLALWVERHCTGVLEGKLKIKPLIDVNLNIIRGLNGDPGQGRE